MGKRHFLSALACAFAFASGDARAQCKSLTTTFAANNQGSVGGQIFFDLSVSASSGVNFDRLEMHCSTSTAAGSFFTLEILVTKGTYVGNENAPTNWVSVSKGSAISNASPAPTPVDIDDFLLKPGDYGVTLILTGAGHRYTNGNGSNQKYGTNELTLAAGAALNSPWSGNPFTPRVWNGTLFYDCGGTAFCTAKAALTCGAASIGSVGISSASATSGFVISAAPARSCRMGVLLINTSLAAAPLPFHGGTLCVDPSGLRTAGAVNAGGTPGPNQCDGAFSIDLNTFASGAWTVGDCAGSPTALPAIVPAAYLQVPRTTVPSQFWGRDTPATGALLSNAWTVTIGP